MLTDIKPLHRAIYSIDAKAIQKALSALLKDYPKHPRSWFGEEKNLQRNIERASIRKAMTLLPCVGVVDAPADRPKTHKYEGYSFKQPGFPRTKACTNVCTVRSIQGSGISITEDDLICTPWSSQHPVRAYFCITAESEQGSSEVPFSSQAGDVLTKIVDIFANTENEDV